MVIARLKGTGVPDRKVSIFAETGLYLVDIGRRSFPFEASTEDGEVVLRRAGRSKTVDEENALATLEFRRFRTDAIHGMWRGRGRG